MTIFQNLKKKLLRLKLLVIFFYIIHLPNLLIFSLGHAASATDVISYRPLQYNTKCIRTEPPDCTAIDTSSLDWSLHGHHDYYVTIKVTNLAGLSITKTSVVYTHDIQLPSAGIVYDINLNNVNDSSLKVITTCGLSIQ